MNETLTCQSCGMPMKSPEDFGTNADGSPSAEYCRYCFQSGEFTAKMEMPEYIEMQIKIAVEKLGMPEDKARAMAESTIPNLKRWKK
ncbi:MAG: zinc ribbon domain-containing protein [Patescibacteria group bacterium]|nr:zinc ribbon domain-containing protein [Patescibacteria group bacterium]